MDYYKARERNLKIKLLKVSLSKGRELLNQKFTEQAINRKLYFKKSDVKYFKDTLFDKDEDGNYLIKSEVLRDIDSYYDKFDSSEEKKVEYETILKTNYLRLKEIFSNFGGYEDAEGIIDETKEVAAILHWVYMPLYAEEFIINSDIIPEENLIEYYNHFHTIEDLYNVIFNNQEISWESFEGDINLDFPVNLKIYSQRWGHDDLYQAKRTINGWNFKHLSYDVECLKDGTLNGDDRGGLYAILSHDSIFYPIEGVKYALETLWNKADKTLMNGEDLERMLQEIGDWINEVEKATKKSQPNWVGYY